MSTRRALALAIFVLGVGAAPPAAAEWRRIDSPNFVVIGDAQRAERCAASPSNSKDFARR